MKSLQKKLAGLINSPWLVVLIGGLSILITLRSILGPNFFRPHDYTHAARLVEMQRSLQAGEFPVRWSWNFGFGYGMPLFNFYAPLPYYLGQLPLMLGFAPVDAIKFLYLLNGVLAFAGMYLLAGKLWGKWGGLISALVFSFSTYRALDLFVRGALGEAFALVLIPFALYGVLLVGEKKHHGIVVVAISLAAILTSHNLTGMVMVGLVALFWLMRLLLVKRQEWKWQIVALLTSLILGVGLSAFYVLPAFFEKNLTRVDQTITVGYFDYHNHFLCYFQVFKGEFKYGGSLPGCSDDISFAFGALAWGLLAIGLAAVVILGKKRDRILGAGLTLLLLGSLFLTIGRSTWIWDQIELLKYFQFPWRFLTFAHVFFAALTGAAVMWAGKWKLIWVLLLALTVGLMISHSGFYWPERILRPDQWNEFYNTSPEWIRKETSQTLNDYLPPSIKDESLPQPVNARFVTDGGTVKIEEDKSDVAIATVSCPKDCLVKINIFQYPGWQARVDGKPAELILAPGELPVYQLQLSKGEHKVEMHLYSSDIRRTGNWISLLTVFLLLAGFGWFYKK